MAINDIRVDLSQVDDLRRDLERLSRTAYPYATRSTMNQAAFKAREKWQDEIGRKMINRNRFTKNSIRVIKAKGTIISQQESVVGSIAPYMDDQEFGGTKRKKGKFGVPIPTTEASGEGRGVQPRKKLPMSSRSIRRIKLRRNRVKAKNRRQRNLLVVRNAVETGKRFVYLKVGDNTEGIFRVRGGSKKTKRGWPKGANIDMMYDLSRDSVRINRNPTMYPAVRKTIPLIPLIHKESLEFQIKRQRLFRNRR